MEKIILTISIVIMVLIITIVSSAFYWFQWRPAQIRKECGVSVSKIANENKLSPSEGSTLLNFCIKKHGLEK
ncbi:MAG: hypothetical protein NTY81_01470 [Candidatus Staskawiczbacteria bacterium]|nr:hypothetical protein [Candidatus Staskawiczbacteria bacterium]